MTTAKKLGRPSTKTPRQLASKYRNARSFKARLAGPEPRSGKMLVGTASWTDPGFVADWYPPNLSPRDRLQSYAEHFKLVEVNSSFYAIPSPTVVARWCEQTPADFVFDVKLHRLLSRHSTPVNLLPRDLRSMANPGHGRVVLTPKLEKALTHRFMEAIAPFADAGKLAHCCSNFRRRSVRARIAWKSWILCSRSWKARSSPWNSATGNG